MEIVSEFFPAATASTWVVLTNGCLGRTPLTIALRLDVPHARNTPAKTAVMIPVNRWCHRGLLLGSVMLWRGKILASTPSKRLEDAIDLYQHLVLL